MPRTNTKPASTSRSPGGEEPQRCLRSGRGSTAAGRRRKSSAAELVNTTSCLKASEFKGRTGHQVAQMMLLHTAELRTPKERGFILLSRIFYSACQFGRNCLTKPKKISEKNQCPIAQLLTDLNPGSRTHPKSMLEQGMALGIFSEGWWSLLTSAKLRRVHGGWEKETHRICICFFFLLFGEAFVLHPRGDQPSTRFLCLLAAPCPAWHRWCRGLSKDEFYTQNSITALPKTWKKGLKLKGLCLP